MHSRHLADISLVAFVLHLQLKPPVEFGGKKLDNGDHVYFTPLDGNHDSGEVRQMKQRVCVVIAESNREKSQSSRGGLNSIRPNLCSYPLNECYFEHYTFVETKLMSTFIFCINRK